MAAQCSRCSNPYDSVLVWPAKDTAGLADRAIVLRGLANLAASLCAQLIAPTPVQMLDTRTHNGKRSLEPDTSWSRYFSVTSWNGVDVLSERWNASYRQVARLANSSWRRSVLDLHANSVQDVVVQYHRVARATAAGEPFVWTIGGATNYRDFMLPLSNEVWQLHNKNRTDSGHFHVATAPPHLSGDCDHGVICVARSTTCADYVSIAASLEVQRAAWSAFQRLAPEASAYGDVATLHVRRGDTIKKCNTSVPAVLEYLRCARLDSSSRAVDSQPFLRMRRMLLFTDETDARYVSTLLAAIESEFASQHLTVSHADPAVRKAGAHADDNFFTFAMAAHLMQKSGMQFGVHRCKGHQPGHIPQPECGAHLGPVHRFLPTWSPLVMVREACNLGWCSRNTHLWSTKCGWASQCDGCETCGRIAAARGYGWRLT